MNANTRNEITTAIDTAARRYNALLGSAYETRNAVKWARVTERAWRRLNRLLDLVGN